VPGPHDTAAEAKDLRLFPKGERLSGHQARSEVGHRHGRSVIAGKETMSGVANRLAARLPGGRRNVDKGAPEPTGGAIEDRIMTALRAVEDPELHASIVELGMVRSVAVDGGRAEILVALTVAGCPMRGEIDRRITEAVQPLDGLTSVHVQQTVMSPGELSELRGRLGRATPDHAGVQGGAGGPGSTQGGGAADRSSQPGRPAPLGHEEGRANRFSDPASTTRVIGITSGKGGVGKSSITVNLAVTLAGLGHRVGLLDADVYGFSVPAMVGLGGQPSVGNGRIVPPEAFGVRVISVGFFVAEDQPVMWRGPMLHKALEQFLVDVEGGDLDYLLVDMPPGTGDVALSMSQYLPASEVYVVTTPQPAARRVAQRTAYMARKIHLPLRGVIENMSWFEAPDGSRYELFGQGGGEALADELGVPLLGKVPLVPALRQGGDDGVPVSVGDPTSPAALAFKELADTVVGLGRARVFRSELRIS
jgi:ATP-binding protein involved in chromosome partitioning